VGPFRARRAHTKSAIQIRSTVGNAAGASLPRAGPDREHGGEVRDRGEGEQRKELDLHPTDRGVSRRAGCPEGKLHRADPKFAS
jgi:hypothetical protein